MNRSSAARSTSRRRPPCTGRPPSPNAAPWRTRGASPGCSPAPNLVIVARDGDGRLIGISRSITDGAYATYLSDLAVDAAHQGKGVGRDLIRATREAAPEAKLILPSAPAAVDYYPHIGFTAHNSAWTMDGPATSG